MFTLGGCILIIVFVLLLLYLLLLPRPFINEKSVERTVNQLVFVCHASTGIKTTLFTELGLWRRSSMAWRRASGASGTGCRGLGSGAARMEVHTTDPVVQWLARGARRGMRGIWRRSSLFRKRQARSRLGEVINIVPPIGTARRRRSCRVDSCLWAIERTRVCFCTFGAKTNVIDFGFGGTRVAIC
jgi:hypothetical protein